MATVADRLSGAGDGRHDDPRRDDRSRGQILLVGGLALAVALLVLAVVLNSAIYTENLATRNRASAPAEAVDLRWDVTDGVGGIVEHVNREHGGDDFATLHGSHYADAVGDWHPMAARHAAVSGANLRVSRVDGIEGTRIVDADPATNFTPRTDPGTVDALGGSYGVPNWLVAANVTVRGFVLDDVDRSSLASASAGDPLGSGAFFVEVRDDADADAWRVSVYRDGSGDLSVTVYDVEADSFDTCTTGESTATIDLTGAALAGEPCEPLAVLGDVTGPASVFFADADEIVGTYELTVDRAGHGSGGALKDAVDAVNYGFHCAGPTYHDDPGAGSPSATAAIYAATVEMRYDDRSVTYESGVRVAPGEASDSPAAPVITGFSVTDASDGSDASFDLAWSTDDPDGDAVTVEATLHNADDDTTNTYSVSGGSASLTEAGDDGDTYEVTLTASDGTNDRSATETHVADGDDTGCPA